MKSLIDTLSKNSYVILGRAGIDFYPDPPGTRIEEGNQFMACLGGSAANIAVGITQGGGYASLITSLSDDAVGRFCLNQLDRFGVDCSYIKQITGELRTSLAVSETRTEDTQTVIYRNGVTDLLMNVNDITPIQFSDYGALIATGTVFAAEPSRSASFYAFELAKQAGLPIILDLDYRPYSWESETVAASTYQQAAQICDIIVGNELEFACMAGSHTSGIDIARHLAHTSATIVVYKKGEQGAITITANEEFRTGIYTTKALKPTGAGDAFMGGFITSLAKGHSLKHSIQRGSAAAAIVVSKIGCAPAIPTQSELDLFLTNQSSTLSNKLLEV